ncbi:hypothetical protein BY996DRAFT_6410650 [Phakopsora pachyrhizi]|nr:hypothetical protein BY996DRAFT_6410650 [Phakopsora pachyrhizi]
MYNKPQGTLPEANISLVALRTSAVKSSRWYDFFGGGGSQANSLADCFGDTCPVGLSYNVVQASRLTLRLNCITIQDKICIFEDFGSEVLKVWVGFFRDGLQDKPQGLFPEAEKLDLQGRAEDSVSSGPWRFRWGPYRWFVRLLFAAQYEKGVRCNP